MTSEERQRGKEVDRGLGRSLTKEEKTMVRRYIFKFLKGICINKMLRFASQISQVMHNAPRGRGSGQQEPAPSLQAHMGAAPRTAPCSGLTPAARPAPQPSAPCGARGLLEKPSDVVVGNCEIHWNVQTKK